MGNLFTFCYDSPHDELYELNDINYNNNSNLDRELLLEIKNELIQLKESVEKSHVKKVKSTESLNKFIDNWCENNVDENIKGRTIPFVGDVEELEKNIYKKNIKLIFEILEKFLGYSDII